METLQEWLSVTQAARLLGISRQAVVKAIHAGKLESVWIGSRLAVRAAAVARYRVWTQPLNPAWFWAQFDQPVAGCWEWPHGRSKQGYGRLELQGQQCYTHRVAWELTHGAIPEKLLVLHHCDNPPCCRPDHLFLGTQKDNTADAFKKGRRKRSK